MVQAESSSWQTSVVELARAGNLRAIAFWINRYLVPQGICAQVLSDKPGYLLVRVVCHRVPDRDRLVDFICYRLSHLNSQVIRAIRVTAQLVGHSKLLWEKTAVVPSAPQASATMKLHPAQSVLSSPRQTIPPHASRSSPAVQTVSSTKPASHTPQPLTTTVASESVSEQAVPSPRPAVRKKKLKPKRPIFVQWSRSAVRQAIVLPETVRQLSVQSVDWFSEQTLPVRALTVGGSAIAIFFVGCGFELMRQYTIDPGFGQSGTPFQASFIRNKPGMVQAALDQVPVIRPTVANPTDPSVTLLFSNRAALGRVSETAALANRANSKLNPSDPTPSEATPALEGGLDAYHQADLVMTSLDHSLSLQQLLAVPRDSSNRASAEQLVLPSPEQEMAASGLGHDRSNQSQVTQDNTRQSAGTETTIHELLANGVDVVNLANDLSVQPQSAEVVQTIEVLQRSNIQFVGTGDSEREARQPRIFDVKGQRIAYLGYADPTLTGALAIETGMAASLKEQMVEDIQSLRDQVDWIVVSFRWQRELRAYPEAWQVELAHLAVDQGADLVVGYHPHLTQGAEVYKGRPIAYSLGSSVEEMAEHTEYGDDEWDEYSEESEVEQGIEELGGDRRTVSLKVTLHDQQMKVEFLPVQLRSTHVALATGEDAAKTLGYLERASSLFEQPLRSAITLDARVRMSLPSAPDSDLPTEPFLAYPESPTDE
ncbi:CapA family protein [Thermocoleostomius sinensis]|uniref:CapA family protein n=1 Tax=Thermocoleostomius sinensis A174 TaxID=2016057 RepID=A0A9E9C4L9_9CYAN|nr:CapA family protein [Thermocoleostomius sinensis]WAL60196.1 CapA family protein [Thermocoleostomius sinensis A174]